jgi:hypothetical protein
LFIYTTAKWSKAKRKPSKTEEYTTAKLSKAKRKPSKTEEYTTAENRNEGQKNTTH